MDIKLDEALLRAALSSEEELTKRFGRKASVYLVGGFVRDSLLGREVLDADFVVLGASYEEFAKILARKLRAPAIPFKDNTRVPFKNFHIDISAPRGEAIEEDLLKRDFTVNNLALSLRGELIGDIRDLELRVIRPVYKLVFKDDPLRILRGFRLAAALGFTLSEEFKSLYLEDVPLLKNAAAERITSELRLLSSLPCGGDTLALMDSVWRTLFEIGYSAPLESACGSSFSLEQGFSLFLALLSVNPRNEKLALSRSEARTIRLLYEYGREMSGEAREETARKVIWRAYEKGVLELLTFYLKVSRTGIPKSYEENLALFKPELAERVLSKDIIAGEPERAAGVWIHEKLEEEKIKVAFTY